MPRGTFINDDLDIFLSEDEAWNLAMLQLKDRKVSCIPLEVMLQTAGDGLKAVIQKQNFECLGDGIEMERMDYGFFIRLNQHAYERLVDNKITGTRYDAYNKLTIRVGE